MAQPHRLDQQHAERLERIRARREAIINARAQRDAEAEQLRRRLEELKAYAREHYGVESLEEIRALYRERAEANERRLSEAEQALAAAEQALQASAPPTQGAAPGAGNAARGDRGASG